MTTLETQKPASIVGLYSTSAVDWIAEHIVTEEMVDHAIKVAHPGRNMHRGVRGSWLDDQSRRAKARRNIAIGIRAGSYWPYFS